MICLVPYALQLFPGLSIIHGIIITTVQHAALVGCNILSPLIVLCFLVITCEVSQGLFQNLGLSTNRKLTDVEVSVLKPRSSYATHLWEMLGCCLPGLK